MPSEAAFRDSRRSTRVPLKVVIAIEGDAETRTCDGETIVVNLQGALIATAIELSTGMKISIHVYVTDKRAKARVVYIDPKNPLPCGIELAVHQRYPTGDVIVSERDLAEEFRKRPDVVITALNLLLNERKVQRAPLRGYWKLNV